MRRNRIRLQGEGAKPSQLLIMKFGGTSVAGGEQLLRCAGIVRKAGTCCVALKSWQKLTAGAEIQGFACPKMLKLLKT